MHEHIDIYCERLGPELWAEPMNALSNISFLIAAYFAYLYAKERAEERNALNSWTIALIALMAAIGIGSFLFHTFAVGWAMLADVIPILLFQIVFLIAYSKHIIKLPWVKVVGLVALFFALSYLMTMVPRGWFNGSQQYGVVLFFLAAFAMWQRKHARRERNALIFALLLFALSITYRTIDEAICMLWHTGVHYLWHVLNGAVLYLSFRAYVGNLKRVPKPVDNKVE